MGYRICHSLDTDTGDLIEVFQRELAAEWGYDYISFWGGDSCLDPEDRERGAKAVSARHPGVSFTLYMEGSDGAKWSETYLNGTLEEQDEVEEVSRNLAQEIRAKVKAIEDTHMVSEPIRREDFNDLKALIDQL